MVDQVCRRHSVARSIVWGIASQPSRDDTSACSGSALTLTEEYPPARSERSTRVQGAAFFDLDRTLISRATPLALANSFRRRHLVRRRDLVRAALWQLVFLVRGVGEREIRRAAEDGMRLLRGVPVAAVEDLLAEAMERVLRPLVYRESLELVRL